MPADHLQAAASGRTASATPTFSENLSPEVEKQTYITLPTLPPDKYPPAGKELVRQLRKEKGGSDPDPYALYSYEAMNAILLAIENAGVDGDDRQAVVDAFFAQIMGV